jgi:hypothetical protein
MWESRRDFQRVWEGWEAGIMAFHAFHTLSFSRPVLRRAPPDKPATPPGTVRRTCREIPIVVGWLMIGLATMGSSTLGKGLIAPERLSDFGHPISNSDGKEHMPPAS